MKSLDKCLNLINIYQNENIHNRINQIIFHKPIILSKLNFIYIPYFEENIKTKPNNCVITLKRVFLNNRNTTLKKKSTDDSKN